MEEYPNNRKHTLSLKIHNFTGKKLSNFTAMKNFQSWLPKNTRVQVLRTKRNRHRGAGIGVLWSMGPEL